MIPYLSKSQPKSMALAKYLWKRLSKNQSQGEIYVRFQGYHFTSPEELALWLDVELEGQI